MCDQCGCIGDRVKGKVESDKNRADSSGADGHTGSPNPLLDEKRTVEIVSDILSENKYEAGKNLDHFNRHNIFTINLMSSPGSGKTSLLEKTAEIIGAGMGVLEGDLETNRDADRIRAKGVSAHQITTGQSCHLDAFMVHQGFHQLNRTDIDFLFIENVGNLVCPAVYDLGSHRNVVLLSVPEGDDKVAKYPVMFRKADLLLISKSDLKIHFNFSTDQVISDAKRLNPQIAIQEISTEDENSIAVWIDYIKNEKIKQFS